MRANTHNDSVERHTMNSKATSQGKKAYHSPRLVLYGDLQRLTRGGGGVQRDGPAGSPKTKASGSA